MGETVLPEQQVVLVVVVAEEAPALRTAFFSPQVCLTEVWLLI
jgi:hypothetical protein